MKSDRKKRILAAILCMVMVLSGNISALAEGEVYADPDAVTQMETPEAVSETQPESAPQEPAAEEPPVSTEPAAPEAPAENNEPAAPETPAENNEPAAPGTPAGNNEPAAPETPAENNEPAAPETPEAPAEEAPVFSEETELIKELWDASGKLVQKVTAKLPKGAFEAETSQIEMEVTYVDSSMENYIKGMMEKKLPTDNTLGDYFLYNIQFKVNGEAKESLEPITITFENSNLEIKDAKKANVFFFDPANPEVSGDKDELVEITQRSELLESLQAAGQSTATMEEDYDLSSIEIKEENRSGKIVLEGRKSTIYGCYVEKEPEEEPEQPEEKPADIPVLNYEDDKVTVSVTAEEAGVIPEGAELKVVPITSEDAETKEQYQEVEKKIQEKVAEEEKEVAGFLAYDITFVDKDGNEMEPNGKVKVSMNYKKAELPQEVVEKEATDAEVTVLHLEEDENGEVKQVVDMGAEQKANVDTLITTEGTRIQNVEAETTSFSVFTITWKWTYDVSKSVSVEFIDSSGKEINLNDAQSYNIELTSQNEFDFTQIKTAAENSQYYKYKSITDKSGQKYRYVKAVNVWDAPSSQDMGTEILKLKYNDKKVQSQREDNKNWESSERDKFYIVYKKQTLPDPKPAQQLTMAETVDTSNLFTMRMIDYNNAANGHDSDIGGDWHIKQGPVTQGLVKKVLQDGYPVTTKNNISLSSCFSGGKDATNLFLKNTYDETGYYEYSSFENYAYFNRNSGNFTVYNQLGTPRIDSESSFYLRGNFLPYTPLEANKVAYYGNLYDENGNKLDEADPRYNEALYYANAQKDNNSGYFFGMYLDANFVQLKDGNVLNKSTSKKENMIYEFNGDDDLWVYIDNVLVLDIGGEHDAHSGTINFATGEVKVQISNDETKETTIKDLFKAADKFPNGETWNDAKADQFFRGNTFKDYTGHNMKMFYMERGAGASNLHVKFNLPMIPKGTVNVTKIVEDKNGNEVNYASDIDFLFQINVNGSVYANQSYDIIKNNEKTGSGTTDANGQFKLKHGETARFTNLSEDQNYQVKELGAYLDGYKVHINGTEVQLENEDKTTSGSMNTANSGKLTVGYTPAVYFKNRMEQSATLTIKKELKTSDTTETKEFSMKLLFGGKPFVGSYKIGDEEYVVDENAGGIIKLQADQTATISGLPYGIQFEIQEMLDGSYKPTYAITGNALNPKVPQENSDGILEGNSASAQVDGDCTVTVTNEKIPTGTGTTKVAVEKKWTVPEGIQTPEYVKVTLYEDTTAPFGQYNDGDKATNYEVKQLDQSNNWKGEWTNLPGDVNYVVKEEFPPGYKIESVQTDNVLTELKQIGEKHAPNNMTTFNIGKNNLLFIKLTGGGSTKFLLWTPINLNLSSTEIGKIAGELSSKLSGVGSANGQNTEYKYGDISGTISVNSNVSGHTLSFGATSDWALFWTFSYNRSQNITLTNTVKADETISIPVKKQWVGDQESGRPTSVTIQLYQDGQPYSSGSSAEVTLNASNQWKNTFTNLPFYKKDSQGKVIGKHVYTVKETKIGDTAVDANTGKAEGYRSTVEQITNEDGTISFVIKNIKDWQIVKVSANSNDVKLQGAVFELSDSANNFRLYGISDVNGKVQWYSNQDGQSPYTDAIADGAYKFKELKAPAGYAVNNDIWTIAIENGCPVITDSTHDTLTSVDADGIYTYYFQNTPIYSLPSTGGTGIFVYTIGGTLLLMAAALLIYKMKREEVLK